MPFTKPNAMTKLKEKTKSKKSMQSTSCECQTATKFSTKDGQMKKVLKKIRLRLITIQDKARKCIRNRKTRNIYHFYKNAFCRKIEAKISEI